MVCTASKQPLRTIGFYQSVTPAFNLISRTPYAIFMHAQNLDYTYNAAHISAAESQKSSKAASNSTKYMRHAMPSN